MIQFVLMNGYQNLTYTKYLERNSSEYIHSINNLTGAFTGAVVIVVLRLLSEGIVAIMILGMLAWQSVIILVLLMKT